MKSRKIPIVFALALALLLTLFSCCRNILPRDYRESAFSAEIRFAYGKDTACAEISVGAPTSDAEVDRDVEIRFTAPEALAGLCAERKNGISRVTLGSADVKSEAAAEAFLRAAELLLFDGELKILERYEENGLIFYRAEISGADKSVSLLLDSNGAPKRVSFGDVTVTVIRFQ